MLSDLVIVAWSRANRGLRFKLSVCSVEEEIVKSIVKIK